MVSQRVSLQCPFHQCRCFYVKMMHCPMRSVFPSASLSTIMRHGALPSLFRNECRVLCPCHFPSSHRPLRRKHRGLPISSHGVRVSVFISTIRRRLRPPYALQERGPTMRANTSYPNLLVRRVTRHRVFHRHSQGSVLRTIGTINGQRRATRSGRPYQGHVFRVLPSPLQANRCSPRREHSDRDR